MIPERTRIGLLSSLTYQLLQTQKQQLAGLVSIYAEMKQQQLPGHPEEAQWQPHELEHFLSRVLGTPSTQGVTMFIDALDEYDPDDAKDEHSFFVESVRRRNRTKSA
jgi:hypothetical protein